MFLKDGLKIDQKKLKCFVILTTMELQIKLMNG